MLKFIWSIGLENFEDAHFIRDTVFIKEQGFEYEFDETDKTCRHLTVYVNDKPAATGRLFIDSPGSYHIGRVAVLKEYRGRHLGAELMKEIIKKAKELGAKRVVLGAQEQAKDFYSKLGFVTYGDTFLDEGCPHVKMRFDII